MATTPRCSPRLRTPKCPPRTPRRPATTKSGLAAFDRAASREADQEAADGEEPGEQQPKPASHKRKRSPWVSALTVVGVLALVCTGTTVGLALGLEHRYENKVTR